MAKIIKMMDLLKKEGIELGKVYTDKTMPPFKVEEEKLTETKFYAFWKNKKHTIDGTSLWDAKKKAIEKLKIPKSKYGLLAIMNAAEHDRMSKISWVKQEGKLTEKINRSKVNSAFTKAVAAIRKISRKLSDDDNYEFIQKLEKWLK